MRTQRRPPVIDELPITVFRRCDARAAGLTDEQRRVSHLTQLKQGSGYADEHGYGTFTDLDVSAYKVDPWKRPELGP